MVCIFLSNMVWYDMVYDNLPGLFICAGIAHGFGRPKSSMLPDMLPFLKLVAGVRTTG